MGGNLADIHGFNLVKWKGFTLLKRKKFFSFILCFIALLSISVNLYFLLPRSHSSSISRGYYASIPPNGSGGIYGLSIWENNDVRLYGPENKVVFQGKLEFNERENYYLITTDSATYRVAVQDDVIFLPVMENGATSSRLFTRAGDAPVTYE